MRVPRHPWMFVLLLGVAAACGDSHEEVGASREALASPRGEELLNVTMVAPSTGTLDLLAVGASTAHLYHRHWDGSGWFPSSGWETVPGFDAGGSPNPDDPVTIFGTPSAVANGVNGHALDVFAVQAGGTLGHYWWNGSTWRGEGLGGQILGSPAAVSWSSSRVDVFVVGPDQALYHQWWNGDWQRDGSGKLYWPRMSAAIVGSPTVISPGNGQLDVFVVGAADNALYHKGWNGSTWVPATDGEWHRLDGTYTGTPAAIATPFGEQVFAVGRDDGGALHHWTYDQSRATFYGYTNLGGQIVGSPAVSSWRYGELDVLVTRSTDGAAYRITGTSPTWRDTVGWSFTWSGWERLGGQIVGNPAVASRGTAGDLIVAGAYDGQVYHKSWTPSGGWWPCADCDNWEPLGAGQQIVPAKAPWLILTCGFQDHPGPYLDAQTKLGTLYASGDAPNMNLAGFYSSVSGGYVDVSDAAGSVVLDQAWLTLPKRFADYYPNYCGQNPAASNDGSNDAIYADCIDAYANDPRWGGVVRNTPFYGIGVVTSFGAISQGWTKLGRSWTSGSLQSRGAFLIGSGTNGCDQAPRCNSTSDCGGEGTCNAGLCRCAQDSDCAWPRGHCDGGTKTCVECESNSDCPYPEKCDATRHVCGCASSSDCPGGGQCDATSRVCLLPMQQADVVHETGHGFGFSHGHALSFGTTAPKYGNNWDDEYGRGWDQEYGDGWDVMACMSCSSFSSPAYGSDGPGLSAGHLTQQGWFSPNNRFTYLGGTPTISLIPINQVGVNGGGYQFARIPVRGLPQHYYTVELRSRSGYDVGLDGPVPAVVIHEINAIDESVLQIKNAQGQGEFLPGDTFTDALANVKITVVSFQNASSPTGVTAQVTLGRVQ